MLSVVKHIIMTSLLLSLSYTSAMAEVGDNSTPDKTSHHLGFNIRPSYILVSHPFWKDHNSSGKPMIFSGSAHLQYAFGFSPDSHLGKLYPGVIQGIGIGINFLKSGNDMKWLYTVFNLKTFVSEHLFLLTGYRFSSLQNTHNLMFGIGYRIHKS